MSDINIKYLPVEMLEKILQNLEPNDLKACASVCLSWQGLAVGIMVEKLKEACRKVLGASYVDAYMRTSLSWEQLFASLQLWREIKSMRMTVSSTLSLHTQCAFICDERKVPKLQILENGIVAFPQFIKTNVSDFDFLVNWGYFNAIVYYDLATLQLRNTHTFEFAFCMYAENEFLIVLVTRQFDVHVYSKIDEQLHKIGKLHWSANFYLAGKKIIFKTENDMIQMITLVIENNEVTLTSRNIAEDNHFEHEIKAMITINENRVDLITDKGQIYAVTNQSINHICNIDINATKQADFLRSLKMHGFDWTAPDVYRWIKDFDVDWPLFTGLNHSTVKAHGNVLLIGTTRRVLEIYVDPYKDGVLQLQKLSPTLKVAMPRHVTKVKNEVVPPPNGIVQIEVIEILDGHRIAMLYDKRIVVVEFKKIIKRSKNRSSNQAKRKCQ